MAWDEKQEVQIREALELVKFRDGEELGQIKMFGGLCFTLNKKMMVGVGKGEIMIRLKSGLLEEAMADGRIKPMDFTGKPLKNFAYLSNPTQMKVAELAELIERSAEFVRDEMMGKTKKKK